MEVNSDNLQALFYGFSKLFQGSYEATEVFYKKIAVEVPSGTSEERYPWLTSIPRVREWLGERVLHGVASRDYAIRNRLFELSIKLSKDKIEDDQLGLFSNSVSLMGEQVGKWPDDLIIELLKNGTTQAAFDGQPFFNNSHPVNPDKSALGTYSNNFVNKPLTHENYRDLRAKFQLQKDETGRTMRTRPTHLVVGPSLETAAKQILQAEFVAPSAAVAVGASGAMQTNTNKGAAELLVIPDLEEITNGDVQWLLMDSSKPLKPFIFQKRQAPAFVALDAPTHENVVMRREFVYAVDMRGAAGYGLPFLCWRATAAGS